MGIDSESYSFPATRRDVGHVTITLLIALSTIADELEAMRSNKRPSVEGIAKIREASKKLEVHWDKLAGWTPDE